MIIEYYADENNLLNYQLYVASTSERIKKKRRRNKTIVPLFYGFLGVIVLVTYSLRGDLFSLLFGIFLFIAAIGWYFIYPFRERKIYIRHYKDFIKENHKTASNDPTILQFENDFIFSKSAGTESKILLTEIQEIDEIPTIIIIRLPGGKAFVIPKERIKEIEAVREKLKQIAATLHINYTIDNNWKWK